MTDAEAQAKLKTIFGPPSSEVQPTPDNSDHPSLDQIFGNSTPIDDPNQVPNLQQSTPTSNWQDPGSQFGPAKLSNFADLGKGVVKGSLNTLNNLSQAGQSIFKPINSAVLGTFGQKLPQNTSLPQNLTTPSNAAQQVGFGGEQLAEFLLPMGAAGNAEKGIKAAIEGSELPNIIKTGLKVATKTGMGALTGGGVAAAQQGGINDNVIGTAALSGAIPGAQEFLEPFLTKVLPSRLLNSLIKPASKEFAFGKNPGLALANEGIVSNSLNGLKDGINGKLNEIGSQIGDIAKQTADAGGAHDATSIIKKYSQKAISALPSDVERNVFNNRLKSIFSEFTTNNAGEIIPKLDETGNPILKNLTNLPSDEFHKLQSQVGKLAKWTGEAGEKGVNKIFKNMYSEMGQELDKTAQKFTGQSTKALQGRYANLLGAQNAIENRVGVATRNAMIGGKTALAAAAGATQGNSLEDRIRNSILSGLTEKLGESTIGSPLFKSGLGSSLVKTGENQLPKIIGPLSSILSNSKVTSNKDMAGLDQIMNSTQESNQRPTLDQIFGN